MLAYCLFKIYTDYKTLTLKHLIWIPIAAISIFSISYIQITLKIPGVFIIFNTILFFIAAHFISWNPISILIGGIIASLIFFHSISYLRLRFMPPKLSWQTSLKAGIFQNDPGEVAGLVLTAADMKLIQTIQKDLDSHDKYLFIPITYSTMITSISKIRAVIFIIPVKPRT